MTYASDDPNYTADSNDSDVPEEPRKSQSRWYAVQVASGCEKRVKLNLEPNTMFRKHLFWIMRKEATVRERTAELKELTRYKNPELSG